MIYNSSHSIILQRNVLQAGNSYKFCKISKFRLLCIMGLDLSFLPFSMKLDTIRYGFCSNFHLNTIHHGFCSKFHLHITDHMVFSIIFILTLYTKTFWCNFHPYTIHYYSWSDFHSNTTHYGVCSNFHHTTKSSDYWNKFNPKLYNTVYGFWPNFDPNLYIMLFTLIFILINTGILV